MSLTKPWCVFVTGSRDLEWDKHWTLVRDKLRPFDVPRSVVIHGAGGGRNGRPGCDEITEPVPIGAQTIPLLWAVETFVENRWASNDYPDTTWINVRSPDGRLIELAVYAEQAVHFRAVRREPA